MGVLEAVEETIRREGLLRPTDRIVVGVSGGPDSLCLLDCLHRLRYTLIVGHLDHGLRSGSDREAAQVGQIAESMGLPFVMKRVDVRAQGKGGSLEEAARIQRYRFLVQVAKEHSVHTIATGHTADDQAETVLMHLLRGAGPTGLRGMLPKTRLSDWVGLEADPAVDLVRPLLEIRRRDTEAYCLARGLQAIQDASNLDTGFLRNRLRHELLPILKSYNPRIHQVLIRTARVMAAEAEILSALVDELWKTIVRQAGDQCLALRKDSFEQQPIALQRGLIRRAVRELRPHLRDVGFQAVERVREVFAAANLRRRSAVGGLECLDLGKEVVLRNPAAPISFPELPQLVVEEQPLTIPGTVSLEHGRALEAVHLDLSASQSKSALRGEAEQIALDAARIPERLMVRAPRSGDRIRPLGLGGTMKVSDLFVNCGIPWPARARWPLVVGDDQVLWVVGLRMSHEHRLKDESTRSLVLRLKPSIGRS